MAAFVPRNRRISFSLSIYLFLSLSMLIRSDMPWCHDKTSILQFAVDWWWMFVTHWHDRWSHSANGKYISLANVLIYIWYLLVAVGFGYHFLRGCEQTFRICWITIDIYTMVGWMPKSVWMLCLSFLVPLVQVLLSLGLDAVVWNIHQYIYKYLLKRTAGPAYLGLASVRLYVCLWAFRSNAVFYVIVSQ